MDEKYILINNRKIAYHMKGIDTIYFDGTTGLVIPGRGVILGGARDCKYHTDLDWVMDPVRKIIADGCEFKLTVSSELTMATFKKHREADIMNYSKDIVEAIYKSVIDYIDEFNEQKLK